MALNSPVLRLTLLRVAQARPTGFGRHASAAQDLADSLARQAEHVADFLKGLALPVQPADDGLAFQVSLGGCHGHIKPTT